MDTLIQFLPMIVIVALVFLWIRSKTKKTPLMKFEEGSTPKITIERDALTGSDLDPDAWEGSMWEAESSFPVNAVLKLNYTDGNGQKSERMVTVREFSPGYMGGFILGYCHLRNGTRTFRVDRIQSCTDLDSGELITDIKTYLKSIYDQSTDHSMDQLLESDYDLMRVLLYVGKADGAFRQDEKKIVAEACCELSSDSRITAEIVTNVMNKYIDMPTLMAFKQAIGRISKLDKNRQKIVLKATKLMIATQKTIHPSEQEAVDYMVKRFGNDV